MNNNSHETAILAAILLIAVLFMGWTLYPGLVKTWEKAGKAIVDPAGQAARL